MDWAEPAACLGSLVGHEREASCRRETESAFAGFLRPTRSSPHFFRLPAYAAHHLAPALQFNLPIETLLFTISQIQLGTPAGNSYHPPLLLPLLLLWEHSPALQLNQSRSYQVPPYPLTSLCSDTRSDSQDLPFDIWYTHSLVELRNFRVGHGHIHHLMQHLLVLHLRNPKCRLWFSNPQTSDLAQGPTAS